MAGWLAGPVIIEPLRLQSVSQSVRTSVAIIDKVKDDEDFVEYPCFFCEKIICDKKEFKDHKLNCHDKLVLIRKVRTFKAPELPQVSYFPHIGFRSVGFPNFPPGDMFPINSYWNKKSL